MKKLINYSLIITMLIPVLGSAQDTTTTSLPKNTITNQVNEIIDSANKFRDYKLIRPAQLYTLLKGVNDSISQQQERITTLQDQITKQEEEIGNLNSALTQNQKQLTLTEEDRDAISLFGFPMSKNGFKILMASIIGALAIGLIAFILRHKKSYSGTKEAQSKLSEIERDFEDYRAKALDKEQKMGRLLQDERNKVLRAKQS